LLGAVVAFLFPHPHQRGHQRLIHRLGDQVDQQVGDEDGGDESIHCIGAAIDSGDGKFLEGGDGFDQNSSGGDRCSGAEDAAIDAAAREQLRDLGDGKHEAGGNGQV
jgi:hypothetical protein